jgi:hypothetical protein
MDGYVAAVIFGKSMSAIGTVDNLPKYSIDMSAAWEVVENMKQNYDVDIMYHRGFEPNCWSARFPGGPEKPQSHFNIIAETAPEAICKASLIACLEV